MKGSMKRLMLGWCNAVKADDSFSFVEAAGVPAI